MGTRETQRREWREAVARAAEEYVEARTRFLATLFIPGDESASFFEWCMDAVREWNAAKAKWHVALSAPKPWTRPAKADLGKWGAGLCHLGSMLAGHWGPLLAEVARETINARLRPLRRKRRAAQRRRR